MQGWNRDARGRKNSQKMTLKALFLCRILLRNIRITFFFFFPEFARFILKGPPYLFLNSLPLQSQSPAHSCMQIHAHTNTLMQPFTHQLCYSLLLYEAITQLPPLWQSSQITSIWIPLLFLRLFICFLFLAAPALSGLPLFYPCGSAPILSLSNTEPQKKEEKSRDKRSHSEAIHIPSSYLQRGDSGSVSRSNADLWA